MKKILIGALLAESNAYVQKDCEIQDFTILTGPAWRTNRRSASWLKRMTFS